MGRNRRGARTSKADVRAVEHPRGMGRTQKPGWIHALRAEYLDLNRKPLGEIMAEPKRHIWFAVLKTPLGEREVREGTVSETIAFFRCGRCKVQRKTDEALDPGPCDQTGIFP